MDDKRPNAATVPLPDPLVAATSANGATSATVPVSAPAPGQEVCGYPSCDCVRDAPPDPSYCAQGYPRPTADVAERWRQIDALVRAAIDAACDAATTGHESAKAYAALARSNLDDAVRALAQEAATRLRPLPAREAVAQPVEAHEDGAKRLPTREPVARVPVHPRLGRLWANVVAADDPVDRPAHYPQDDLFDSAALASEREAGRREAFEEAARDLREALRSKYSSATAEELLSAIQAARALTVKGTMAQTGDE